MFRIFFVFFINIFLISCNNNEENTQNGEVAYKHQHFQSGSNLYCDTGHYNSVVNSDFFTLFNDSNGGYYIGNREIAFKVHNCTILFKANLTDGENTTTKEAHFINGGSLFCSYGTVNMIATPKEFKIFNDYRGGFYLGNQDQAFPLNNCTTLVKTTDDIGEFK